MESDTIKRSTISHSGRMLLAALFLACSMVLLLNPRSAFGNESSAGGKDSQQSTALTTAASESSAATPIEPGDYYIFRADAQDKAIDVSGGSKSDAANIQLYEANATKAQIWRVSYDKQGRYTLINVGSGKALDAAGARMANGTNIHQYKKNGTLAQKWVIESVSGGYRIASSKNHSYVLDCYGGGKSSGTNIHLYRWNNTAAQKFVFFKVNQKVKGERTVPDGMYMISSKVGANKVLDVYGASTSLMANVHLYSSNGTTAQRWMLKYGKDGYYTIECMCSGMVLDVAGAKKTPGGNIWQFKANGTTAQKWAITKNRDGTYSLICACNGLAASVAGGKNADGANIQCAIPNASKAQKFVLTQVSAVDTGVYTLYTKLGTSEQAVGIRGESITSDAKVELQNDGNTMGQRFYIRSLGDGYYSLQSLASGQYVTDKAGKVVQRPKGKSGTLSKQQQWRITVKGGGILIKNAATGKAITVSGDKATSGAALVTQSTTGSKAQLFRVVRQSHVIQSGTYKLYSRAGNLCIDVKGGSWASGTNAWMYTPNNTNAQKFTFVRTKSGYYFIYLALTGNRLTAGKVAKNGVSNVSLEAAKSGDAQLWKVTLTDSGIEITNKMTGGVLAFSGKTAAKSNVCTMRNNGRTAQLWRLQATTVNAGDNASMKNLVGEVPGYVGSGIRVDAKGHSYLMSSSAYRNLASAVESVWGSGSDVGFAMIDLNTGITVSLDGDRRMKGASTFKAAYVTYIFQDLLDTGRVSLGDVRWLMEETIVDSNNDTYRQLRGMYGNSGFRAWLDTVGLGYLASEYYPSMTAKELALIWMKLYAYEESGGRYTWLWRQTFNHSYYSCIREALSGSNTVYSKPGWVPASQGYAALNDGAIVIDSSGRPYVLVILSDVNCYGDQWMIRSIASALNSAHRGMPAA